MRECKANALLLVVVAAWLGAQTSPEARTRQVLELWQAGKYAAIYAMFDDTMRDAISVGQYRQIREHIKGMGAIKITGVPKTVRKDEYAVVTIPFNAGSTVLNFEVSWDQKD